MAIDKKISILVEQQFPEFFRSEGPQFVKFLEAYYEWLELNGNVVEATKTLIDNRDIDTTIAEFIGYFQDEFIPSLPQNHLTDNATLVKNAVQFHRSRGSEKSYKFFFKIMYNDNVNFYYPGTDVLRASDGRWVEDTSITVENPDDPLSIFDMEGTQITGFTSGATATVERVINTVVSGLSVYTLTLRSLAGTFVLPETITSTSGSMAVTTSEPVLEDGMYIDTKGFLSSNKFLQDNDFYQDYSYELQSSQFVGKYRNIINKVLHPSGTKLFGSVFSEDTIDLTRIAGTAETEVIITLVNSQLGDALSANNVVDALSKVEYVTLAPTITVAMTEDPVNRWRQLVGTIDIANSSITTVNGTGTMFTDLATLTNEDFVMIRDNINPDSIYDLVSVGDDTTLTIGRDFQFFDVTAGEIYYLRTDDILTDYGLITDGASEFEDYELVSDVATEFDDYEFI